MKKIILLALVATVLFSCSKEKEEPVKEETQSHFLMLEVVDIDGSKQYSPIVKFWIMRIMYEIQDGYAGKSRPQYVNVSDDELNECETYEEKKQLIEDAVQEHFEQNIYPFWNESQLKEQAWKN